MVKITVKKHVTDIERTYTHFEFVPCDDVIYFKPLRSIFTDHLGYTVEDNLEWVWVSRCTLRKGDFVFELFFQDYYGNCLCHSEKQDEAYYDKLEALANEVTEGINTNHYGLRKTSETNPSNSKKQGLFSKLLKR